MTLVTVTVDVPDDQDVSAVEEAIQQAAEQAGGEIVVYTPPDYGVCDTCGEQVTDIASESYVIDGASGRFERRYCVAGHRVETWSADERVRIGG